MAKNSRTPGILLVIGLGATVAILLLHHRQGTQKSGTLARIAESTGLKFPKTAIARFFDPLAFPDADIGISAIVRLDAKDEHEFLTTNALALSEGLNLASNSTVFCQWIPCPCKRVASGLVRRVAASGSYAGGDVTVCHDNSEVVDVWIDWIESRR